MKFILLLLLICFTSAPAVACWDYLEFTYAEMDDMGQDAATIMVTPGGTGDALTAATMPWGSTVDATITLYLRDCVDIPVAAFPKEDMWLESADGGLVFCQGGSIADADTDANGVTTWTQPLRAGGYSQSDCLVKVNGSTVWRPGPMPLHFNSPDLSGDGEVNLTDVPLFTMDFFGAGHFRSDYARDGQVNLSDVVKFSQSVGSSCP